MKPAPQAALSPLVAAATAHLVMVDVQPRLAAAMKSKVREQVYHNIGLLLHATRLLDIPVVVTEQYPKGLGHTDGSLVQQFPEHVTTLEKTAFSCCGARGFLNGLDIETRPQIVVAGMESHVCVLQTALDLVVRGFEVFVVQDAACSRRKANHRNALERLRQWGITTPCTESMLFEWLRDASHAHFKTISKLVR